MPSSLLDAVNGSIAQLRETQPSPADPPTAEDLTPPRDRIDAIDRALLTLLNERLAYAHYIGKLKKESGDPVYAPDREANIIDNVRSANEGPLPDEVAQHLFERIIEQTRLLELQNFEAAPSDTKKKDDAY